METTINQRIKIFMMHEKLNTLEIASIMGISRSQVSNIINGHSVPRNTSLTPLFEKYPKLNRAWLMMGEGEMYGGQGGAKPVKKSNNYVTEEAFELLSNEVQLLRQSITKLMGRLENFPLSPLKAGKKLDLNLSQGVYLGDVTYKQSA